MKKKEMLISIIVLIGIIFVTLGISYSLFTYTKQGTKENSIKLGNITFLYSEVDEVGNGISIKDAFPISDQEGKNQVGEGKVFDFEVTATLSRSDLEYEVVAQATDNTTMPIDAVKFYLTDVTNGKEIAIDSTVNEDGSIKTLDSYSDTKIKNQTGKTVYQETILKNTKNYHKKFRARMWLKEDLDFLDEKYMGKQVSVRINVFANSNREMVSNTTTTPTDTSLERIVANEKYVFIKSDQEEYGYELTVPRDTEDLDLSVITSNMGATYEVTDLEGNKEYTLVPGENYFKVEVTASDGKTKEVYTIKVIRQKSSDTRLEIFGVDGYILNPLFSEDIEEYRLSLEENKINIIANAVSDITKVTGAGEKNLSWGENEFIITVTAEDGTIKSYKIIVNNIRPTAPVIEGGSSDWLSSAPTISVLNAGSAVSGVKTYEYYKTTSTTPPTDDTIATGTTSGNVTVSDEGTTYIYYRTVSNKENKSVWSGPQVINLETNIQAPVIAGGNSNWVKQSTINVTKDAVAASGISKYQYYVSTSNTTQTGGNWQDCTTSKNSQKFTAHTKGPKYVYFRAVSNNGKVSNVSNSQVAKVDSTLYEASLNGNFSYTGANDQLYLGYYIEVDPNKTYKQTMTIKTNNTAATYYLGFTEYDIDYNLIVAGHIMFEKGSTTYLTRDLNPGDTIVYLNSTQGFDANTTKTQRLGFIIWNYQDSTGYTYPKETYSRNVYFDLYTGNNINKTNNTITLNSAWTGPAIKKDTYLSQSNSGSTLNYGLSQSKLITLSTNYQTFSNTISGIGTNLGIYGNDPTELTKFRPGVKYVKPMVRHNYNNVSSDVTTTVSSYSFVEVKLN